MPKHNEIAAKISSILAANPLNIADFQPIFTEISQQLNQIIGHKLCTFTVIHPSDEYVIRLFSNQQGDYALEDTKPMVKDQWSVQVIENATPFCAATPAEMQPVLPDYQKLVDMGLGSMINIPICQNNKTIGTANLLDADGAYKNVKLTPIIKCCQLAAPIFAAYRKYNCN
ncbi:MAG: hypothetical protein COB24_07935 [Hyphomicrobiales bacterium]|nr:MAG: hypothetical protein COB24_07935 [Hyphomicrobiales bacterium]